MSRPPVIALLTDFGNRDAYAGIMKGVILSRLPDARIIDITHDVPPQDIVSAAFLLGTAWRFFPEHTVFVVVVDPGVGSARRRIAVQHSGRTFIGPDNGCLSAALADELRGQRQEGETYAARPVPLDGSRAVLIENPAVIASDVSATFEGRDVFAPAAASIGCGEPFDSLGRPVNDILAYPAFRAPGTGGRPGGVILHIDHYGNAITDIRAEQCQGEQAVIAGGGKRLRLVRTYAEAAAGEAVALVGSTGYLELAVRDGSAASTLGLTPGAAVIPA